MSLDIINPFYFSPVREPELFAGRFKQKQRMMNKLKDASCGIFHHIALLGGAGMGKTSLLNVYEHYIRSEYSGSLVCRIDLDDTLSKSKDPLDIFKGLETTVLKELRMRDADIATYLSDVMRRFWGVDTGALSRKSKVKFELQLPYLGGVSWERTLGGGRTTPLSVLLKSDFDELRTRAKDRGVKRIMVMIDEADVLKTLPDSRSILQLFKNTFQNLKGYMIVFSGNINLLTDLSQINLGFASLFDPVNLAPLSTEEGEELIKTRLDFAKKRGPTVEFTDAAKEKLIRFSNGSPREIVRLCYLAVESIRGKNKTVNVSVVQNMI